MINKKLSLMVIILFCTLLIVLLLGKIKINRLGNALVEANDIIEEAQSHAWTSYDEMGEALESLDTIKVKK